MAIFMKYGSIEGQVTTSGYKGWIELNSMQFGVGRAVGSGAGGAQREGSNPSVSEISVSKAYDKASAELYQDALSGNFDTKVTIKFTSTSKDKVDAYLSFELEKCGISGYSISSGGDNGSESLTLNFAKIMVEPSQLDEKGTPKAGKKVTYDLLEQKTS